MSGKPFGLASASFPIPRPPALKRQATTSDHRRPRWRPTTSPYGSESQSSETNVDTDNRAPLDHSLTEIAGTNQDRYVYDALLGDHVRITRLVLTDDAPLCNRWRGEFIAMLTPKMALPNEVTPLMLAEARAARARLITNPTAPRTETQACYF